MEDVKRAVAVVIGVNKYLDDMIEELHGAVCDATEFRDRLVKSGGFEISNNHFLIGKDATCQAIRHAISDLLWQMDPSKLTLFYFSGHGFRDEYGNGYLAPYDIDPQAPLVCGIRMQELQDLMLAAKNKKAIVAILDCCYSGIATEGKGSAGLENPRQMEEWFSALQKEGVGEGRIILASSRKDEKSREIDNCTHEMVQQAPHAHGKFTYHLLEGLDGKAAVGGDERITLDSLRAYIDLQMKDDPQHKMSFLGAGVSQANQIIISRATQWQQIQRALEQASSLLQQDNPWAVCGAAQTLKTVITSCPKLDKACALNNEINTKLQQYGGAATEWLVRKMMSIGLQYRDPFQRLQDILAGELSVDTFMAQDESMQGLIITIFLVVSEDPATKRPYRSEQFFINQLRAQSAANRQRITVVQPQTSGSGNLS